VCVPEGIAAEQINESWLATFPNPADRPARVTHVYPLPDGQVVQLQVAGVLGEKRQPLEIPGLTWRDPIPAGCRIGSVVFSSLVEGEDPATGRLVEVPGRQVQQAFRNAVTLVEQAGGTVDDVAHVYILVRDRADNDYT